MAKDTPNPKTPSSDYKTMAPYWRMASAIIAGVEALRAVNGRGPNAIAGPVVPYGSFSLFDTRGRGRNSANQSPYLPQFPNESNSDYAMRRQNAPLTNIYNDISKNLSSKPFSKKLELSPESSEDLLKLAEDIDGQSNNLHVFSAATFKRGIDKAIDWILIDYNKVDPKATLADERAIGARPYWVNIPAERMLAVYSDFVHGKELFVHARIYEPTTMRIDYEEVFVERVREFNREPLIDEKGNVVGYGPATFVIKELKTTTDLITKKETATWEEVDSGPVTIGIIPLVAFKTGEREGTSWRIEPPLKDVAYMQIEEFQQESNLKSISEACAFPMLAGNGVLAPKDKDGENIVVPVGPKTVLFAPPNQDGGAVGSWSYVEPAGSSLVFLKAKLEKHRDEMRELGMQPLASANLTVVTTANISLKANSAVQAWALGLKDALEQAWKITCLWLGRKDEEPVVNVHVDFGVELEAGTELGVLLQAEGQSLLSPITVREELKRRGVLSDDFDEDLEQERLAEHQQGQVLTPEKLIDPITGMPVVVQPKPGVINPPSPPKPPLRMQ